VGGAQWQAVFYSTNDSSIDWFAIRGHCTAQRLEFGKSYERNGNCVAFCANRYRFADILLDQFFAAEVFRMFIDYVQ